MTFANTISEHKNLLGLLVRVFHKGLEVGLDHFGHSRDDLPVDQWKSRTKVVSVLSSSLKPDALFELIVGPIDGGNSNRNRSLGGTGKPTSLGRRMSNVGTNHHGIRVELAVRDGVGNPADLGLDLHRHCH